MKKIQLSIVTATALLLSFASTSVLASNYSDDENHMNKQHVEYQNTVENDSNEKGGNKAENEDDDDDHNGKADNENGHEDHEDHDEDENHED